MRRFFQLVLIGSVLAAFCPVATQAADLQTGPRRVRVHNPPEYPAVAKKLSIHGTVQLTLKVSADGMVKDVSVTGGNPVLVDASVKAVRQWRYEATGKESQEPVKFVF